MQHGMQEEIDKAIRANLSEEVGVALREVLQEGADAKKVCINLQNKLDRQEERLAEVNKTLEEAKRNNVAQTELTTREAVVRKRENGMDVMDAKLEAVKESKAELFQLVGTIFANPTVRKETFRNINHSNDYSKARSENVTETTKEE